LKDGESYQVCYNIAWKCNEVNPPPPTPPRRSTHLNKESVPSQSSIVLLPLIDSPEEEKENDTFIGDNIDKIYSNDKEERGKEVKMRKRKTESVFEIIMEKKRKYYHSHF